jgi:glycosyltransferase involved in cell wall biosynthesis
LEAGLCRVSRTLGLSEAARAPARGADNTLITELNVLLLHNRYREPGGEERSVSELTNLLRSRGHVVDLLERSSQPLRGARGRGRAGTAMLRGGLAPDAVAEAIERSGAELVHAHNIHPLLGPRALAGARAAGARVVMHLHNYRLFCAIGIAYRDGGLCTRCHKRNTLPGVRLRCRGSLSEAAVYGAALSLHQPAVLNRVDRFIVPSRAAARRLEQFGLTSRPLEVMTNFLSHDAFADATAADRGEYGLLAGRLVGEKGIEVAIEAAARARVPLAIAGSGPDSDRLGRLARELDAPVRFLGRLSPNEMKAARRGAAFALAPSLWDEPCPYSVIEAMAAGLPVLASNAGGLPELVGGGTLPPGAVEEWSAAMDALWTDPALRRQRGADVLEHARELFGPERAYDRLMRIYELAMQGP